MVGFDSVLLADGFDDALIGITEKGIAVYSIKSCIDCLMSANGWSEEEAVEWMEYNVCDAYVGPMSPIYVHTFQPERAD